MKIKCSTFVLLLNMVLVLCGSLPRKYVMESYLNNTIVKNFVEYVKIDTSKESNLPQAVDFWCKKAKELDLDFKVFYPSNLPVLVISWYGTEPTLPSIMLNSHMDVVPAVESEWTHPPFSAYMDENGDIYGRGTQDDKDVAILYLEAIRKMKQDGVVLKRTLHITLMPDEETGGKNGIEKFITTKDFENLNIGFALDEGLASDDDTLLVTYQDKRPWQMKITLHGDSGHGYSTGKTTAMEKFRRVLDVILDYKKEQTEVMRANDKLDYGSYDSLNVNIIEGGVMPNVVPGEVSMVIDMRLAVSANVTEVLNRVSSWVKEGGDNTTLEFIRKTDVSEATQLDGNPYWYALRDAVQELGIKIEPVICPATSDMVSVRSLGVPALGLSHKLRTSGRAHSHDEYLNVDNLIRGVDVYVRVLNRLGNLDVAVQLMK